ncbi:NAD-dependent epimerase/dehydratase family protein [Micromonospora sp. CPCC 205539]|uniref:NAD-dependent epimerase/dehydratase family protein n=1 Tax=Micromonospora sp. CPCC 205539 TaxID=3122408 RepID=UPI002FF0E47B
MRRALVTGGAGFIGLHLCRRLLADGFEVVVVDNMSRHGTDDALVALRPHLRIIDHDLTDGMPSSLPAQYDIVFHLAAWVGVDRVAREPFRVLRDNVAGTMALVDWCTRRSVGALFLSSTSEVADGAAAAGLTGFPVPEDGAFVLRQPHEARATYALSKLVSEALLLHHGGFPIRIGRYYNVYGPRMGLNHVIPQFVDRALQGVDPFPIYGGTNTRAFCHVSDAVEATMRLAELPGAAPVTANIGDDTTELSMRDLAELVTRAVGTAPRLEVHAAPPGSPDRRVPDLTRLRELTGYRPRTGLAAGIADTVRWYAERLVKVPR